MKLHSLGPFHRLVKPFSQVRDTLTGSGRGTGHFPGCGIKSCKSTLQPRSGDRHDSVPGPKIKVRVATLIPWLPLRGSLRVPGGSGDISESTLFVLALPAHVDLPLDDFVCRSATDGY